jgi:putative ABC transport system permease protein
VQGRAFDATDTADAPRVALVNQTLARRLAPAGAVIGQSIRLGNSDTAPPHRVVGVVADTRWIGTTLEIVNEVYTPFAQDRASFGFVVVESRLDTMTLTSIIRAELQAVIPDLSMPADRRTVTLDELIGQSVAGPRFSATLVATFSAMAFALAVIGLFGLVMYSLAQRRRELGIRAALGARPGALIAISVRRALALTATGIAVGLAAGALLTRFVESQLYAIEPLDRPTFAAAACAMLLAAGAAAYVPARRAVSHDPIAALRDQ